MDHGLMSRSLLILIRLAIAGCFATLVTACSMGQMVVRGSQTILDSGIDSMNRETDLQLARDAMPANLKLIEGMLIEDPKNTELRLYAAEGFYGYSFGFIETEDPARAQQLYRRCYGHAQLALQQAESISTRKLPRPKLLKPPSARPARKPCRHCSGRPAASANG